MSSIDLYIIQSYLFRIVEVLLDSVMRRMR